MDVHRVLRFRADPEAVFAMLTSEEFLRRRAQASHALSADVSVGTTPAGAVRSELRQTLPAEVPDFVRKLTGPTIDLTEEIVWDDPAADRSRTGTITMQVQGAPVHLHGTVTLSLTSSGTEQVVRAELKAAVPMIGGKIERAAEPAVIAGIDVLEDLGRDWL